MKKILCLCLAFTPSTLLADPLDRGEAYTTRSEPPEWMDNIDLGLLLVDYAIFGLTLVALGWILFKRPTYLLRLEAWIRTPFSAIFAAATRAGGISELLLQVAGGIAIFAALAIWVFFCQWLKHIGLGAFSMIGLGLLALLLVRMIKGNEREIPVP